MRKRFIFLLFALLAVLNVWLFRALGAGSSSDISVSFLDVGQGDAALIALENDVQILIDGGPPNGKLVGELGEMMPAHDRTIELVILTHPELDHYGGFIPLLERYEVKVFADAGVKKEIEAYEMLERLIAEKNIRRVVLREGDRIRYGSHIFSILSPDNARAESNAKNDTSIVLTFETNGARFLFTGDISVDVERALVPALTAPYDVLKVSHHGSKFSSAAEFLAAVRPTLATIGVGENSYGHPTSEALSRLTSSGARVYRTDRDGTVTVRVADRALRVFAEQKER